MPKIDAAMQTAVAELRKAEYATVEDLAAQAGVAIPTTGLPHRSPSSSTGWGEGGADGADLSESPQHEVP